MKKIALLFTILSIMVCLLAISASAEVIIYDSYEEKTNLTYDAKELVTFDDGCSYPSYYIFSDSQSFETDYDWLKEKTGKSYSDANVVELCIPTGVITGGSFKSGSSFTKILKLNTGKTLTKTGGDFWHNKTLTHVTFGEGYTNAGLGTWFFTETNIEYVIFDDNSKVTTFPEKFFINMSKLKGIYLGASITNIGSGTFADTKAENIFLMNTPNDTEASEVYYFKSNLVEGNFYGLNMSPVTTIWVFPSEVNGIGTGWNIDNMVNLPKQFVFLTSNASSVTVNNTIGGTKLSSINIYFPNISSENAKSMSVLAKATYYFGVDAKKATYNGGWSAFTDMADNEHLYDPTKDETTKATCVEDGMSYERCFCNKIVASIVVEEAYGHSIDLSKGAKVVGVSYEDVTKEGTRLVKCANCESEVEDKAKPILSGYTGYSIPTNSDRKGITFGYNIDVNALNEYKSFNEDAEIGFVVAVDAFLVGAPLDDSGKANTSVVKAQIDGEYFRADFILSGDIWEKEVQINDSKVLASTVDFLMCAYSYNKNTGVQYIQSSVTELDKIERISYEKALSNVK